MHFRPISIGRDYGNETEIVGGLKPGDVIVRTVSDEVQDGVKVQAQFVQAQLVQANQAGASPPSNEGRYGNQQLSNQGSNASPQAKQGNGSGSGKNSQAAGSTKQ